MVSCYNGIIVTFLYNCWRSGVWGVGCGVWGVGCGVWGEGRRERGDGEQEEKS